jgi:hypothetical protein
VKSIDELVSENANPRDLVRATREDIRGELAKITKLEEAGLRSQIKDLADTAKDYVELFGVFQDFARAVNDTINGDT